MQPNTQQTGQPKENFFDEGGNSIEAAEVSAAPEEAIIEEATETSEGGDEALATAPAKYRIGDREFATQEEAIAFAQSHLTTIETERQVAEAYQAGLREALKHAPAGPQTVTPEAQTQPAFDDTEFYTNPQGFLAKYAERIKSETQTEVERATNARIESERIWSEFTQRHPMLAEFRGDVEDYVNKNVTTVQAVIATKGRTAAYDYVATQIKARAAAISAAAKPHRALPNVGTAAAPASKPGTVTKTQPEKKSVSMAEQIRKMRQKR